MTLQIYLTPRLLQDLLDQLEHQEVQGQAALRR